MNDRRVRRSRQRSRQEIVFTVLREIGRGAKLPTRIMYASNLSWSPCQIVFNTLLSDGFITEEIGELGKRTKRVYCITEKGEKALDSYFGRRVLIRNIEEIRWALNLLDLEQSDEWCMALEMLLRTTEPFTINSLCIRSNLSRSRYRVNKLMDELKKKALVTEHKVSYPENWDSLTEGARAKRAKEMGLARGWHVANYLVFDQEKFTELLSESVENRIAKLVGR